MIESLKRLLGRELFQMKEKKQENNVDEIGLKQGSDKKEVTDVKGDKVYVNIPRYGRKRIFGTENEYGVIDGIKKLPGFIQNGGKIYYDCNHIEYASPETSNPLEAVIFEKAGEIVSKKYAKKLYKNNIDSLGNSFGAHESYFTTASFEELERIIPFLVTRQIFAGSGWQQQDGVFDISQKSRFMPKAVSNGTTSNRGILCTKDESLSDVVGWRRLHLICGDANMSEVADFLKIGTTGLVLDLVEDGLSPRINYELAYAVKDITEISGKTKDWTVNGTSKKTKATDLQRRYLNAAVKAYQGRDEITDDILQRWGDTLNRLDEDPMSLVGRLDWVTKKVLIESYAQKNGLGPDSEILRNIDLQYHDLDRRKGLFYALQNAGKIERLVSDELIEEATKTPPKDTRAHIRGEMIKHERGITADWTHVEKSIGKKCENCGGYHEGVEKIAAITDPFNNYDDLLKDLT